ncbi:MAG TPA: fasciclin domain-containing protein [Candidatus Limnocylindrales bacterium]|nr:fasciclin domain-containing protein [Candidatus Limnocylindrales bacterium]
MRSILRGAVLAALSLTLLATPAFAAHAGSKPGTQNIVQIVLADDGEFDVLQAAVIEAGLAGVLSSPDNQYTVFAPTDAAFVATFRAVLENDSLTEGDVIEFINAGGVDTALGEGALVNILEFHVTNGRRTSTSVVHAPGYTMLNGERLSRAQLLDAGIAAVDISASNGVIHVINSVLLP